MADKDLFFYHYTSLEAAKRIMLEGKLLPSEAGNGDAAYGAGVYLTTLETHYGVDTIMNNNWDGAAATREKVEAYFEIQMPSTKAVRANDKRDILVHEGVLTLRDYKWNLKSFAGSPLRGGKRGEHGPCMGRYTLYQKAVLSHAGLERVPVYKQDNGD